MPQKAYRLTKPEAIAERKQAQQHFENAARHIGHLSLTDVWIKSSLLSSIEYFEAFDGSVNLFMPVLHVENINLFHQAILRSTAAHYKTKSFTGDDMAPVFNNLGHVMNERMAILKEYDDERGISKMFATMANSQIRMQSYDLASNMGRNYLMMSVLPAKYESELRKRCKSGFIDLGREIPNVLGMSIEQFLGIGFCLLVMMKNKYEKIYGPSQNARDYILNSTDKEDSIRRKVEVIRSIIDNPNSNHLDITFTASEISKFITGIPIDLALRYISLLSKSTSEFRDLIDNGEYTHGLIADRKSPLEAHPVVKLQDERYAIPNFRYFHAAITESVHLILRNSSVGEAYSTITGHLQEFYLDGFIDDRLPNLKCIPERTYKRSNGNSVKGPDLCLIEPNVPWLIALESKAKRTSSYSRTDPEAQAFASDISIAIDAFKKLPEKIDDITSGLSVYDDLKPIIDKLISKPIATVILGEGIIFTPDILTSIVKESPKHILNTYTIPFALVRISVFEEMVEIARSTSNSLYDLLVQYHNKSNTRSILDPSSENLSDYKYNKSDTYLGGYYDLLFDRIRTLFGLIDNGS
jgi:hypothetical protein